MLRTDSLLNMSCENCQRLSAQINTLLQQLTDAQNQLLLMKQKEAAWMSIPGRSEILITTKKQLLAAQNYVVLDFETTGFSPRYDSVIECGAVLVQNGKIVDTFESLVKPKKRISKKISELTGITNDDLKYAATTVDVAQRLYAFIANFPIVAHNASFDIGFLEALYEEAGIPARIQFVDTLTLARHVFPDIYEYSLDALIDEFHLSEGCQTHRALDDALCTQRLFTLLAEHFPVPEEQQPKQKSFSYEQSNYLHLSPQADVPLSHPFYGKTIVFTGELRIPREEAAQKAVNAGAIIRSSVSKKVDFVVVGTQDLDIVGCDGMSTKERTARQMADAGIPIQVIDEQRFFALLQSEVQ